MRTSRSLSFLRHWAVLCLFAVVLVGCSEDEDTRDFSETGDPECQSAGDCGETDTGEWSDCESPEGLCAQEGTQTREVTTHSCENEQCVTETEEESRDCSRETTGIPCDDGFDCTSGAQCEEGDCRAATVDSNRCFIDDQCLDDGFANPDDDCEYCAPTHSQTQWSSTCQTEVHAGALHACALDTVGGIDCWGISDATFHDLGQVRHMPDGFYQSLDIGSRFGCVTDSDGELLCWGDSIEGQEDVPQGDEPYEELTAGGHHACAIGADDDVHCWGDISAGQAFPPEEVEFTHLSAGYEHSCGLDVDGDIHCWGADEHGQASPDIDDVDIAALSAGQDHSCALAEDGDLHCWGNDDYGQIGDVPTGSFEQLDAGHSHSCAVDEQSQVQCWGINDHNQLDVPDGDYIWVGSGRDFSCAVEQSGGIECWGIEDGDDDYHGQTEPPS